MKVLHLFEDYLNTTENWAFRLIDSLDECSIYIGATNFIKTNFYSSKFNYITYPLDSLAHYAKQTPRGSFKNLLSNFLLQFNKLFVRSYAGYIITHARAEKIELMHSHFSFVGYQNLVVARNLKIPHIVSFYGFDYEWLPHNYPEWMERYKNLFREADIFICEGNVSAETLKRAGCNSSKIKIVRLGVNPENINFYQREKKPGTLKLLQVAAFTEKKGHRYTVEAFAKSLKSCPGITLTLVGKNGIEGTEKTIRDLIKENNLNDKVTIIDSIDFGNLHSFMSDYDVFIHPSIYTAGKDNEGGAPVVLLDAQATGMPVLSTLHCDIPDEVLHEKTGLLCNERDVDDLAKNIERFYNMSQEEYNMFAANARKHIEQAYNIRENAKSLQKIYSEILKIKNS